jgi:c-di-AMP phosphodiesterase-like protein|tara:strand:- start:827 stop:1300 length:474 start_codon:yes stop_codon:yes gene_type:complete
MSKLEDNVNEILGIEKKTEVAVKDFEQPSPVPRTIDETKSDIDNDYVNSRDNYYNLIDKGNQAIEGILDIAKEGQHPRAYEVAGQLIGQVAQTVDKLQDLQKKLKDLKEIPKTANTQIKNALFVGSTNELQKMLNRKKEDEIIEGESSTTKKDNSGN